MATCETCGAAFPRSGTRGRVPRYCSKKCRPDRTEYEREYRQRNADRYKAYRRSPEVRERERKRSSRRYHEDAEYRERILASQHKRMRKPENREQRNARDRARYLRTHPNAFQPRVRKPHRTRAEWLAELAARKAARPPKPVRVRVMRPRAVSKPKPKVVIPRVRVVSADPWVPTVVSRWEPGLDRQVRSLADRPSFFIDSLSA
jgi:hypothetical protein